MLFSIFYTQISIRLNHYIDLEQFLLVHYVQPIVISDSYAAPIAQWNE